jgi:hypothetical protein
MKKYKVFPEKGDQWVHGPFNTELLEQRLNACAEKGWKVVSCTSGQFFGATRNEIVVILEKDE